MRQIIKHLFRRKRFVTGGVIPGSSRNSDDVPVFLAGGRAWMRKPTGEWVEINDGYGRGR